LRRAYIQNLGLRGGSCQQSDANPAEIREERREQIIDIGSSLPPFESSKQYARSLCGTCKRETAAVLKSTWKV
jgi:hypothetical protein